MGIQYYANKEDLLAAGCIIGYEVETYEEYDGSPVMFTVLTCEHNGYKFRSYTEDCLVVDCNEWGSNKPRLQAAGMLDIPHTLS